MDGEPVPSVSEITRFISREVYGDIAQFRLDNAAERGRAVHKALEVLDKYGEVEAAEDIVPYIRAYLQFRKEHPTQWGFIEKPICHPDKLYAGTIDRYGTVDGVKTLVDFKTTYSIDPQHRAMYSAAQNLYRKALALPVDRILIIQLKADATYKLYELPIEDDLADACVLLHHRLKKKKRKKKLKEATPDNG